MYHSPYRSTVPSSERLQMLVDCQSALMSAMEACCRKCASTFLHVRRQELQLAGSGTESQPISLLTHKHWCNMHRAKMAAECVMIRLSLHCNKLPVHSSGEGSQSSTPRRADCSSRDHLTSESSCIRKEQWCFCSKSGRGPDGKKQHAAVLERGHAGVVIAHCASKPRALSERSRAVRQLQTPQLAAAFPPLYNASVKKWRTLQVV